MLTDTTLKRLDTISLLSKEGKKINGLFRLMENKELWKQAYKNISSNDGAVTRGNDNITMGGFFYPRIDRIIGRLQKRQYKFKPVSRTNVSNGNGKIMLINGDDKLVQEVVKIILERIYEPVFSNFSYGFRTGRSRHTALEQVRRSWTGVKWLIELDIESLVTSLNHVALIQILGNRIADRRFIKLIEMMLKSGCMENWEHNVTYDGNVQEEIISPILLDIYLSELDNFMCEYADQIYNGGKRRFNPEYSGERCVVPLEDPFDKKYKRLLYNRCADKFIVGIIGTRKDAVEIAKNIRMFFHDKLKLAVAEDKFEIVHASKGVKYLGFVVKSYTGHRTTNLEGSGTHTNKQILAEKMQLIIPKERMQDFAKLRGYGDYCTVHIKSRPALIQGSDAEIIRTYNSELRGLVNYYSIANNARKSLESIVSMGRRSCVMTLAHKHKMSTNKMANIVKQTDGEWIREIQTEKGTCKFRIYRLKTDFSLIAPSYQNPDILKGTKNLKINECPKCGGQKDKRHQEKGHKRMECEKDSILALDKS